MAETMQAQVKLNSKTIPILVIILGLIQLAFPYKGWMILLVGLGGVWGLSYLWAQILARQLIFRREVRFGWAHVGDQLEERFTLANLSFVPALWVEIIDHTTMPGYTASRVTGVGGDSQNSWQTKGICTRRGIFTLGPTTLCTSDPFGLYSVTLFHPNSATLTVTPPIVHLPTIDVAPGGRAGEGRTRPNMFERTVSTSGIRDYVPGDSYNWIHWPSSARRGSLYVRQFDSMPSGDWWIFVDLDRRAQAGEGFASTEEHAVILAASLADRGLQLRRSVGLVGHGQELIWLPPRDGDAQRQEILRALARAETGPHTLAELLASTHPGAARTNSLIIITAAVEATWLEALFPLLKRGAVATVLLLDPVSFGVPASADGIQTLLANMGVTHYLITKDLLDRPEARPGQQGQWQWRVSPSGRAVLVNKPDLQWKVLG
ncbi:MAG: DUF58 domain-containing protein [Anaerolineaceae bacterium]|nr:DUF58 domain-containing protein [Anaerolineaceae bacterium]MCB9100870.1 DUF58 domain-containing protein [Anaerolineales bacterium]